MSATTPQSIIAEELAQTIEATLSMATDSIVYRQWPEDDTDHHADGAAVTYADTRDGERIDNVNIIVEYDFLLTLWRSGQTNSDAADTLDAWHRSLYQALRHNPSDGHASPLATSGALPQSALTYPADFAFFGIKFGDFGKGEVEAASRSSGFRFGGEFVITVLGQEAR